LPVSITMVPGASRVSKATMARFSRSGITAVLSSPSSSGAGATIKLSEGNGSGALEA